MLAIKDLEASYGGHIQVLKGVSITVPDHGVVALLGNNGAGKSTLLRALSGTLRMVGGSVTGGSIEWNGQSLLKRSPAHIVRSGVVQVPEGRRIFGHLNVEENLRAASVTTDRAIRPELRDRVYGMFPILHDRRRQRAGLLSGGEQQMLAIARGLCANPKLLVLDEPSLGLAPIVMQRIGESIGEISEMGTSVLLIEQNAALALELADFAYVLGVGRVSLEGTSKQLSSSGAVEKLYLGGGTNTSGFTEKPTDGHDSEGLTHATR